MKVKTGVFYAIRLRKSERAFFSYRLMLFRPSVEVFPPVALTLYHIRAYTPNFFFNSDNISFTIGKTSKETTPPDSHKCSNTMGLRARRPPSSKIHKKKPPPTPGEGPEMRLTAFRLITSGGLFP